MKTETSFTQLVAQVLMNADRPLTVAEITAQVEIFRSVHTRNPYATIRGAISNNRLAVSLGGRPARYTWWPHHLADNTFRQPLADSDVEAGTLVLHAEIWLALWPDFYTGGSRTPGDVTLALADGPVVQARVEHLVPRQPVWGLRPTRSLAEWYCQQRATPDDELIVHVLDVSAHRYEMTLVHHTDRDEVAIAARNRDLIGAAAELLGASRRSMSGSWLTTRFIAHSVYCHPLPPDPWADVLRADLRFVVGEHNVNLTEKVVDYLEQEYPEQYDSDAAPRPWGNRHRTHSDEARQAWGAYLFDQGMEYRWARRSFAAEAYYRETLRLDPGHADAWVHLGNSRFDEGRAAEALACYEQGQAAAEARVIGEPARYLGVFWGDLRSRPFMRALHGRGLCLWRLGRVEEARQVFAWMLELNPNDNQGVRFLLHDLDEGLSWEESTVREDEWQKDQAEASRLARMWGWRTDDVTH